MFFRLVISTLIQAFCVNSIGFTLRTNLNRLPSKTEAGLDTFGKPRDLNSERHKVVSPHGHHGPACES